MVRTSFDSNQLAPGLFSVFKNTWRRRPDEYSVVYSVMNSKRAYEETTKASGLPITPAKPEGTPTIYSDPLPGSKVRWTHKPWGQGFRITQEMHDFELYGVMAQMPARMALSMKQRTEVEAWSVPNHAFDTTIATGYDGLQLCSTAHTLLRGGTQRNRPTVDAAFGVTSLESALEDFEALVDDDNMPLALKPRMVLGHWHNKWAFREVLGSGHRPYLATNEINALLAEELSFMVGHYLTSTTAWYLLADKGDVDDGLIMWWSKKPTFENADDFDSGDAKYKSYKRDSFGFANPWGWWGTTGA